MHQFQIDPFGSEKWELFGHKSRSPTRLCLCRRSGRNFGVHGWRNEARTCSRPLADGHRIFYRLYQQYDELGIGPEGKKYVPLVFSLFIFILMANFIGMMPFGIVPGVHLFTVTSH